MRDRGSKFYRGGYWPPHQPDVMFKPIPPMERFKKLHYDPRFRVPLHAAVFQTAAVTHHWNNGHFKYPEIRTTVALTEILYLSPPMFHFNLDAFDDRKDIVMEHCRVWSPLHRRHGFDELTAFRWVTDDRGVQEARYGDSRRIVVNFGPESYRGGEIAVPPRSAWIAAPDVWENPRVYKPSESLAE